MAESRPNRRYLHYDLCTCFHHPLDRPLRHASRHLLRQRRSVHIRDLDRNVSTARHSTTPHNGRSSTSKRSSGTFSPADEGILQGTTHWPTLDGRIAMGHVGHPHCPKGGPGNFFGRASVWRPAYSSRRLNPGGIWKSGTIYSHANASTRESGQVVPYPNIQKRSPNPVCPAEPSGLPVRVRSPRFPPYITTKVFRGTYEGPFKVLQNDPTAFIIDRGGKPETFAVDQLKPAHLDIDQPVRVAQSRRRGRLPSKPIPSSLQPAATWKATRSGRLSRPPDRL